MVTLDVVRPKAFVAESVYVVVCAGETLTLVPRTPGASWELKREYAKDSAHSLKKT